MCELTGTVGIKGHRAEVSHSVAGRLVPVFKVSQSYCETEPEWSSDIGTSVRK